ncbi:MAG TPA: Rrf2 family transcriptional regulator [Candidatus Acidoferrum sp.]|nr:Rrf2 family transcriptional regulator [Candidatus Acidoferrum sp.]
MRLELTRRGDYAVRAMLALGRATRDGRLSVPAIAGDMAIPVAFLPQVMRDLVAAGLIEGITGRAGGYRLSRPAPRISVLEIVEAVEGDSRPSTCVLRGGPCGRDGQCDAHEVFFAARAAMLDRLRSATLADLVRRDSQIAATSLPE